MKPDELDERLHNILTRIELAMDEMLDIDTPEVRKAENLLLNATMALVGLIDELDDGIDLPEGKAGGT